DAAVRGAVHLLVVDRAAVADARARAALAARLRGGALPGLLAVERLADNPRERGLAAAPRPAEQERVMDPAARERVRQRSLYVLLSDDHRERGRAILSSEDEIGHGRQPLRLYPQPPTLQRHGLADLLRLDDRLIAQIAELTQLALLVQRAVADQLPPAEVDDDPERRVAAPVVALDEPRRSRLAILTHRQQAVVGQPL